MRKTIAILLTAAAVTFGAGAALASRPVATLPDGSVVDLNTGVATAPNGHHYKVPAAVLAKLREQMSGAPSHHPPKGSHPAPAKTVTRKPAPGTPPQ